LLLPCFVSVHSTVPPPAPPSLPTRRSSDLCEQPGSLSASRCAVHQTRHSACSRSSHRGHDATRALSHRTLQTPKKSSAQLGGPRSEEHTSELQSRENLVCRLLLEKQKAELS